MSDPNTPKGGIDALRVVRYVAWGLVAVVALVLILVFVGVFRTVGNVTSTANRVLDDIGEAARQFANEAAPAGAPPSAAVEIGEPFALVTHTGEPITDAALEGHPSLMFFGFTYCPDVCPAALAEVTAWLSELGDKADDLAVYFVTVDPERDQPEQLGNYLSVFDPRIVGITGPVDDVHAMLDGYRVYYAKYESEGVGYLMDHYASFYLLDDEANFSGSIAYNELPEDAIAKIERLIDESN